MTTGVGQHKVELGCVGRKVAVESWCIGRNFAMESWCIGRELAVVCEGEAADFVGDDGGVV